MKLSFRWYGPEDTIPLGPAYSGVLYEATPITLPELPKPKPPVKKGKAGKAPAKPSPPARR